MTRTGDQFRFPDGTTFRVERPARETEDGATVLEVTVPAGAFSPPAHVHPEATDAFEVLEGAFDLQVDGTWRTLQAGETFSVPPGTPHTLGNRSGETVRVRNVHGPAKRFEEFLAHTDELMRARGVTKAKDPRIPLLFSMLTLEYADTLVPAGGMNAFMTRLMARIGRLTGMSTKLSP